MKLPQVMLEVWGAGLQIPCFVKNSADTQFHCQQVVWDTRGFSNPNDWPEDGSQPLYLSNGDQ